MSYKSSQEPVTNNKFFPFGCESLLLSCLSSGIGLYGFTSGFTFTVTVKVKVSCKIHKVLLRHFKAVFKK